MTVITKLSEWKIMGKRGAPDFTEEVVAECSDGDTRWQRKEQMRSHAKWLTLT